MARKNIAYYELMGVRKSFTKEELRKAYKKKALLLHPDKRGNSKEAQDEVTWRYMRYFLFLICKIVYANEKSL